jgi:hypothetical protein
MLPQRHSHHLSQSARLIIICRLGTCVRSTIKTTRRMEQSERTKVHRHQIKIQQYHA